MQTSSRDSKQALRQQVLTRTARLTPEALAAASAQARALLARQEVWQSAQSVLFFAPMTGELDVWPLVYSALDQGKHIALPRFVPQTRRYVACPVRDPATDLRIGYFGIREPNDRCAETTLNRLDFILVPGVAFDLHGRRLGRGKGFYDQLLTDVRGTTCGVAFDEQMVPEVPVEPHDRHLNCILTPTRWLEL